MKIRQRGVVMHVELGLDPFWMKKCSGVKVGFSGIARGDKRHRRAAMAAELAQNWRNTPGEDLNVFGRAPDQRNRVFLIPLNAVTGPSVCRRQLSQW